MFTGIHPTLLRPPTGGAVVTTTWSPTDKGVNAVLSNGNRTVSSGSSTSETSARATRYVTGDVYFEEVVNQLSATGALWAGFANTSFDITMIAGQDSSANSVAINLKSGIIAVGGNTAASTGISFAVGDVAGLRWNTATGTFSVYKNGSQIYSNNGLGFTAANIAAVCSPIFDTGRNGTASTAIVNFGQTSFTGGVPAGSTAYG